MSGVWGNNIKLSIFGESHGCAVGITIDGLPPGMELNMEYIESQMARRAPGRSGLTTNRVEGDSFEILSGYFNGHTTGTPLCAIIKNSGQHPEDYERDRYLMRPSHADYTGYIKYNGFNDYRGGGHFSGRLTAPLVFAGSICRLILNEKGITIGSHIKSIGNVNDEPFDRVKVDDKLLNSLSSSLFPLLDRKMEGSMRKEIEDARREGDSTGGIIEAAAVNLPIGLGEPFFDSFESILSHLLFSIPAVKGVEFGAGFGMASNRGSIANDEYHMDGDRVRTYKNNNGGITGGITNGMPVVFSAAIKPTPSIAKPQRTVDIVSMKDTVIEIKGRHDPCIVLRALPVVESVTAIGILELLMYNNRDY